MDAEEALLMIQDIQNKQIDSAYETSLLVWSNLKAGGYDQEPPTQPKKVGQAIEADEYISPSEYFKQMKNNQQV